MKLVHINRHCTVRFGKTNSASLRNKISVKDILRLKPLGQTHSLGLRMATRFDPVLAKAFTQLESVNRLALWCDVSRRAMQLIVPIPQLQYIRVNEFVGHGRLPSFRRCKTLTEFRARYISEHDLLRVLHCQTLRYLGVEQSPLSHISIAAIAKLPQIKGLDLPYMAFDDSMIAQLTTIPTVTQLNMATDYFHGDWIAAIAQMTQLDSLCLGTDQIEVADLAPLAALPYLSDLTLNIYDAQQMTDSTLLIEILEKMPALKSIWLKGIGLSIEQSAALESRYESVAIIQ